MEDHNCCLKECSEENTLMKKILRVVLKYPGSAEEEIFEYIIQGEGEP